MKALLWKDLRLGTPVLILTAVLFVLPYVGGLGFLIRESLQRGAGPFDLQWSYDSVMRSGFISLILCHIGLTVLAGQALASEREEGSETFLAALPPSRGDVLRSKGIVAVVSTLIPWVVNVVALLVVGPRLPGAPPLIVPGVHDNPVTEVFLIGTVAALILGVAWWVSSFVGKASTAWVLALLSPLALLGLIQLIRVVLPGGLPGLAILFPRACLLLALAGWAGGSLLFLRRSEL